MRLVPFVLALAACSPSDRDHDVPDAPPHTDIDAPDEQPDAPPPIDTSKVYAHTGNTLYRLDSMTLSTTQIGPITGLGTQSLTDLAIDKSDQMIGITLDKLYKLDAATGAATLVKDLSQTTHGFTSLSYIPSDLDDPQSADILVAANDQGNVYKIDTSGTNAVVTQIGSYGTVALGRVVSSGDLFGVRDFGIYATVNVGTEPNDYLAKIDPVTWKATPLGTSTGFKKIFGLGFWGGRIYGFVDMGSGMGGKLIQIDPNTGKGTEINSSQERWYGAGVTTDAPIIL